MSAQPTSSAVSGKQLDAILEVPYAVLEYEAWIREQARARSGPRDYLFSEDKPRFEPRKDDIAKAWAGLSVQERNGAAKVVLRQGAGAIDVPGVRRTEAERILNALDGTRCLAQVRWASGVDTAVFARFLRATFGLVVFAPDAIESLERALPSIEIVRFPSASYAIERAYWENMAAVRERFLTEWPFVGTSDELMVLLRKLHVIAVMGPGLDSYYKPASPASDLHVRPGALLDDAPRLLATAHGKVFLDGPRVNASLTGGERWHRLVYRAAGAGEIADEGTLEEDGLAWGELVVARAEQDDKARRWFCPPRPVTARHRELLLEQLRLADQACTGASLAAVTAPLARFHQAFVRLHPFHCANQCLAMNIVNSVLSRHTGTGIPHLLLDHLALGMSAAAYTRVFDTAVRAFSATDPDPSRRLAVLRERRARSFALIDRLGKCASAQDEKAAVEADPEAATWALIVDSRGAADA